MSDSAILQKYVQSRDERQSGSAQCEPNAAEDFGAFGWLRGIRDRAVMLELRKKDGSVMAVGYGYIERAEFCPAEGITLHAVGGQIRIKGCNLNAEARPNVRLFEGITRHRVPWIQEADRVTNMDSTEGDTVVERIDW